LDTILKELIEQKNIRSNLSTLRQLAKEEEGKANIRQFFYENQQLVEVFLCSEDAKTRKNMALLLGDLEQSEAVEQLYGAYKKENTLFVKASYLQALAKLDAKHLVPQLKEDLNQLLATEITDDNKKHLDEETRALRSILIQYEGISLHTADYKGKKVTALLITNRNQREVVRGMVTCGSAKVHPLGVLVETDDLGTLIQLRTYRELVFPLSTKGFVSSKPEEAAKAIWEGGLLELLQNLHRGEGSFYYRIECKSNMELEQRSTFTKKLGAQLDRLSQGMLVNSAGDYEVELRLIANKEEEFFPCVKLYTLKNSRFAYRKNAIAASIHPSAAALMMEIAEPYLKENAQIMDPFCGVGTMLIERQRKVPAKEIYGTDIFGEAIAFGRENADLAGVRIHFINRDFMNFEHDYLFDEIVTNMPLRGKKTKQEMDDFYGAFFRKSKEILKRDGVIIMYTNEIGFVKKHLRLNKEYKLMQETCMQTKNDFNLVIIKYTG
jgi:tRNA G10  N-methylase Trm11